MMCILRLLLGTILSKCIYYGSQNNEMFYRILPLVYTDLCHENLCPRLLVLFFVFFGMMILQCFGHVYKLDCEQLKLVCQSMETWRHITLLFRSVKVRPTRGHVSYQQRLFEETRVQHFQGITFHKKILKQQTDLQYNARLFANIMHFGKKKREEKKKK